ncbi:MAG: Dps family protein [Ilumatobacteraceae bacterium]
MTIDLGIPQAERLKIADGLSHLLADTYTLYLKTHKYHWNVTGPMFQTLHLMFETQYTELALAVDLIAERIRALDVLAPGSYSEFSQLASISEDVDTPSAVDMIQRLVEGQEAVVRTARSLYPIANNAQDEVTADLLTQRIQIHEKTAWMLRSLLA